MGRATIGTLACVVLLCGHGLNVSPLGARDNVFIDIDPAASYQYDMPIPIDHPVGLFWYHPHFHPYVNTGIAGGLSGTSWRRFLSWQRSRIASCC